MAARGGPEGKERMDDVSEAVSMKCAWRGAARLEGV